MGFRIGETIKTLSPSIPLATGVLKFSRRKSNTKCTTGVASKEGFNIAHVSVMPGCREERESLSSQERGILLVSQPTKSSHWLLEASPRSEDA